MMQQYFQSFETLLPFLGTELPQAAVLVVSRKASGLSFPGILESEETAGCSSFEASEQKIDC